MILLSVEKFSSSQPCSNIPMQCLRCHNWTNKYSMEDHIKDTCVKGLTLLEGLTLGGQRKWTERGSSEAIWK